MGACHAAQCELDRKPMEQDESMEGVMRVSDSPLSMFASKMRSSKTFIEFDGEDTESTLFKRETSSRDQATDRVPEPMSKDEQLTHLCKAEGIFLALDYTGCKTEEMCSAILQSPHLNSSCVIGVILGTSALGCRVGDVSMVEYLLTVKKVVPFMSVDVDAGANYDGADYLDAVKGAGVFGVGNRTVISSQQEIDNVVEKQFDFAKRSVDHALMPLLRIAVSPNLSGRDQCEKHLCESILRSLRKLDPEHPGVVLSMTCPIRANTYLPLLGHPKVLRMAACNLGASSHEERLKSFSQNIGLVANVSCRDALAELEQNQNSADGSFPSPGIIEDKLVSAVQKFSEASATPPVQEQQMLRVAEQVGFFVGLDHSRESGLEALETYGAALPESCRDDDLWQALHEMRSRVIRDPAFAGDRIIGAILSEDALERKIEGLPTATYLWEKKRVVPYLRLFKNLAPEKNGVQLMKQVKNLNQLLDRAVRFGIFGIKTRSTIKLPKEAGINAAVEQQFNTARAIMAKGLVPVLQIQVDINSPNRVKCERLLYDALMNGLQNLRQRERVILDLTVPATPNTYLPLIGHPNTIRVTALSGGLGMEESCNLLSQNVGLVASFGRAFLENLRLPMPGETFTQTVEEACVRLFKASNDVPTKEMQLIKVSSTDGIFAPLDKNGSDMAKTLQRYGIDTTDMSEADIMKHTQKRLVRILQNSQFNGSVVIGVTLLPEFMNKKIDGDIMPKYVWERKNIVPFIKLGKGLAPEKNGVRLMKDMNHLDKWLDEAKEAGIFGTKMRSVIRLANAAGIKSIVKQQFDLAKQIFAKGLVPILMPEVDIKSPNKAACENILCDELVERLCNLRVDEKVIFYLTLPSMPNKYLPLIHHPNSIRVIALSGGYSAEEACGMLEQNVGMVAGFERTLFADINANQSDEDFTNSIATSCKAVFNLSRSLSIKEEQMYKVRLQDGFLAALDQHRTDIPGVLESYGIQRTDYSNQKDMADKAFEMYSRIIANHKFNGARVIGVVIFEDFLDRDIDYMPCAAYMWQHKRMVPFLKVDRGLSPENNGVQLMKDVHRLDEMLLKAAQKGIFGTKARSVIRKPNSEGIRAAVEQQFEVAKSILHTGLVPIMHLEVDKAAADKPACERMLRQALMGVLRRLDGTTDKVMFQVTLPTNPGNYAAISGHPNVIRVLAPSGGYSTQEACCLLEQNPGMIASFGRALISDLRASQTDREFTQVLDRAICEVYDASRGVRNTKTTPRGNSDKEHSTTPRSTTPRDNTTPRADTTPRGDMTPRSNTPRDTAQGA